MSEEAPKAARFGFSTVAAWFANQPARIKDTAKHAVQKTFNAMMHGMVSATLFTLPYVFRVLYRAKPQGVEYLDSAIGTTDIASLPSIYPVDATQGRQENKEFIIKIGKDAAVIPVKPGDTAADLVKSINRITNNKVASLNSAGRLVLKDVKDLALADISLGADGIAALGHKFGLLGVKKHPTLIVANHTSYFDAPLLASFLPRNTQYAIDVSIYNGLKNNKLYGFILPYLPLHPIDSKNAYEIKQLARLAKSGTPVMIFPEGRLTSTGTIGQIFDGASAVADSAHARIVPVHLGGMNFAPLGSTRLEDYPKRWFPRMSASVIEPVKLELDEKQKGRPRRAERLRQLKKVMHELPIRALDKDRSLIDTLHYTASHFGYGHRILDDVKNTGVKYGRLLTGVYVLGEKLSEMTNSNENVGLLLPNSVAATTAFFGLQAYGRTPAMLNAAADITSIVSCTETAQVKTVVTSREMVAMAKLEPKIDELGKTCKIVYLEDVRKSILPADKLRATMRARGLLPRPAAQKKGGDTAVIIFTSGSEGAPKGVALSSTNILSNIEQVNAITPFKPKDKAFNAMPIFHSFGLSGGLLMPVLRGIRSFQFPSPLESGTIPKAIYHYDATIMFGTDTFLNLYARKAENKDMISLNNVFSGAEALKNETRDIYLKRFGIQIHPGYGLTEASPVVALNVRGEHEDDTVGRFLPCIEPKLEPVPGVENGYRLYIKGPNIMMGYMKHDKPGVIQPPPDGWHDTGDIITLTENDFVKIAGRAKRFAKIGGEMVALDVVEEIARAATQKKDSEQAIILQQSPETGDSLVLFTTDPDLKREHLTRAASDTKRSLLGLPKNADIHYIEKMPHLPTGKTDYVTLGKIKASFNQAALKDGKKAEPSPAPQAAAEEQKPKTPGM